MESESGEVGAQPCLGRTDPEVCRQRQAEATADRRALDHRHDRFARAEQPGRRPVQVVGGVAARAREVCTGTEVLAGGRQDHHPDVTVVIQGLQGLGDRLDHRNGEEVVRRSIETQRRDVVDRVLDDDVGLIWGSGHGRVRRRERWCLRRRRPSAS